MIRNDLLRMLWLYYGVVERKDHGNTVCEARATYMKLMEENAEPKKYKKWTSADKEDLTEFIRDDITIHETDLV